jgi:hypothetical protein
MTNFRNLWIIGNGFDLSCNLNTRYEQFLSQYKKSPNELRLEAHKIKENQKHSIFWKNKHPLAEIFNEPMQISRDTFFSLDYYINHYDESVIKKFKNFISQEKGIITWADMELKLGHITGNPLFSCRNIFGMCMDDLHLVLNKYLFDEDKKAEKAGAGMFKTINKEVYRAFENIDIGNTVFVVLNYTKNFERFIKFLYPGKTPYIVYLHGTADDDNTVIGVGSETQIFNSDFARDSAVTKRLLKADITSGNSKTSYKDFWLFLKNNLFFVRDEVNIFGSSMGGSDSFLWYYLLQKALQENKEKADVKINLYDAYKNEYYDQSGKKHAFCHPKTAIENIGICNMLFFFDSSVDNAQITEDIMDELCLLTEKYVAELEQSHIPESDRLLEKFREMKRAGNTATYSASIDEYLCSLERKFGRIDVYADEIDNIYRVLNEAVVKTESSEQKKMQEISYEKLDVIVSDEAVTEFRKILDDFLKTGELSVPFLNLTPGIYSINEEPHKTNLHRLAHLSDSSIKVVIAMNKGELIDGAVLGDHSYSFQTLAQYANEECECDIEKAILKIAGRDKDGRFLFTDDLSEIDYMLQKATQHGVNRVKKLLKYHATFGY